MAAIIDWPRLMFAAVAHLARAADSISADAALR